MYLFVSVVLSILVLLPIPMTIFYVGRVAGKAFSGWNGNAQDDDLGDHRVPESQASGSSQSEDTTVIQTADSWRDDDGQMEQNESLHQQVDTATITMMDQPQDEGSVAMDPLDVAEDHGSTNDGGRSLLTVPKPVLSNNVTADIEMDEIEMMADMLEESSNAMSKSHDPSPLYD